MRAGGGVRRRDYESSAHHEAEHSLAMSLVDPLIGEVRTLRPAQIAERTVVEVWVERLTPEWGEDFGWQRVGDTIVAERRPSPGVLGTLTPVQSAPGTRGHPCSGTSVWSRRGSD